MSDLIDGKRIAVPAALLISALLTSGPWIAQNGADAGQPSLTASSVEVQAHLAAREYWASETQDGLQAPNRRHHLRSHFEPTGVRVHDRTAAGSPRLVSLRLSGLGRGDTLVRVDAGELTHEAGRVEIVREPLGLTEWFENSERGLEQGFTLAARASTPDRRAAAGESASPGTPVAQPGAPTPLIVELELKGALASLRGDSVLLATEAGRTLRYGKLAVVDAAGATLAAHFEVPDPDRIRLVVDDREATYPIVVDPLLTGNADGSIESGQTEARLGGSVASAGDVNGDGYDDVIVGARFYDSGDGDEGAAFLYLGSADGIGFESAGTAAAQFESNLGSSRFGSSVASAGDVNGDGYSDILIGAPAYSSGGQASEGAAFLFLGSASGIADGNPSTAAAQLESNQNFASLGISVASAGDVNGDGYDDVIVGAQGYGTGAGLGAAFVFHGSASGIADGNPTTASTRLVDSSQVSLLGNSVASAGDVNGDGYDDVIVGAYFFTAVEIREGGAFVFLGSASGINDGSPATAHAQLESNRANVEFGYSVAPAGDVNGDDYGDVVVGARLYGNGQLHEGGAFVFLGSAGGVADGNPVSAHQRLEPNSIGAQGGSGVAAGDVDADGYSDVIVGAQYFSNGEVNEGELLVYLGSATGLSASPAVQIESHQILAAMGSSVAAGDLNGDGADDVIVGAELYDGGSFENEGAAFVYHGSPPPISAPFSQLHASMPTLASGLNYTVALGSLPGRPRLVVEVSPDAAHPDFVYTTEIKSCSVPGDGECSQLSESRVTGSGPQSAHYDVFLCQPEPTYTGHTCEVAIRPISFGSAGAPATVDVTIRGETRVPTGTVEIEIDTTSNPSFSGVMNVGTMPFFNEGQNFRWLYDLDEDHVLVTPVAGRCEALSPFTLLPFHNFSYQFQGSPTHQGLDCCTWQIGSTTGVTGTGQAIFYINTVRSPATEPGDADLDGVRDLCDNCPSVANGPLLGTCASGSRTGNACLSDQMCIDGPCSLAQDDLDRDGDGDVCVPEPGVGAMLASGLIALTAIARCRAGRATGRSWSRCRNSRPD